MEILETMEICGFSGIDDDKEEEFEKVDLSNR
jgi:hypothetical protein